MGRAATAAGARCRAGPKAPGPAPPGLERASSPPPLPPHGWPRQAPAPARLRSGRPGAGPGHAGRAEPGPGGGRPPAPGRSRRPPYKGRAGALLGVAAGRARRAERGRAERSRAEPGRAGRTEPGERGDGAAADHRLPAGRRRRRSQVLRGGAGQSGGRRVPEEEGGGAAAPAPQRPPRRRGLPDYNRPHDGEALLPRQGARKGNGRGGDPGGGVVCVCAPARPPLLGGARCGAPVRAVRGAGGAASLRGMPECAALPPAPRPAPRGIRPCVAPVQTQWVRAPVLSAVHLCPEVQAESCLQLGRAYENDFGVACGAWGNRSANLQIRHEPKTRLLPNCPVRRKLRSLTNT